GTASPSGLTQGHHNFALVFNDTSTDKQGVQIQLGTGGTAANVAALGVDVQDVNGNLLGSTVDISGPPGLLQEGDLIINGIAIGKIAPQGAPLAAADTATEAIRVINLSSDKTGVVA